ncbi:hypothetical protein D3C78_1470490 [compost metagenome]
MIGTSFSRNEKIWINTMPSQKVGTDTNSAGSDCSADFSQPKPIRLETNAMTSANSKARVKPSTANCRVAGRLAASKALTGTPFWIE